jgi:hypothetical protein
MAPISKTISYIPLLATNVRTSVGTIAILPDLETLCRDDDETIQVLMEQKGILLLSRCRECPRGIPDSSHEQVNELVTVHVRIKILRTGDGIESKTLRHHLST